MTTIFKLIGIVVVLGILAVGALVADLGWNESRVFYVLAGRAKLERECGPPAMENLVGRGFSPTDLTFGPRPSISLLSISGESSRTFTSDFTFSDGPNGERVDGSLLCTVSGGNVKVDVSVDTLPRRTT